MDRKDFKHPPPGAYTNVWPAPAARGLFELSAQSTSTYPVSRMLPGQDGDPRGPILISPAASSAIGISRISERRSTVRPSLTHHSQTPWAASAASGADSQVFDHQRADPLRSSKT